MRKTLFGAIAFAAMFVGSAAHAATMTVYKSPSCGCCAKWVEHAERHGADEPGEEPAEGTERVDVDLRIPRNRLEQAAVAQRVEVIEVQEPASSLTGTRVVGQAHSVH